MSKINEHPPESFSAASRKYSDTSILMHEAIARTAGLSGTDHKYLGFLMQHGAMPAGELARLTGLTTGAITGVIDRLEKKKLVKRAYDNEDRRKVIIVPNHQNALKLLGPVFGELQTRTAKLVSAFSEKEIKVIEKYFLSAAELMTDLTKNLNNK